MKKGLLLLSGGIDSPVAGYLMKRKKTKLLAVHFSLEPFTDDAPEKKTRILAKMIGCEKLWVIKHGQQHADIVDKCRHRFYYILTRRLMFRIAEKIAKKTNYKGDIQWNCFPKRALEIKNLTMDNTKAKNLLKWKPKHTLDEGLDKTIDWWKPKIQRPC